MSNMRTMRVSLIHLAAMCAMYGQPTHGMSSVAGDRRSAWRALLLLRYLLAPAPLRYQVLLIRREPT